MPREASESKVKIERLPRCSSSPLGLDAAWHRGHRWILARYVAVIEAADSPLTRQSCRSRDRRSRWRA